MLAKFMILTNLSYRNTLLSPYKIIAISFERTGQKNESKSKNKQITMWKALL